MLKYSSEKDLKLFAASLFFERLERALVAAVVTPTAPISPADFSRLMTLRERRSAYVDDPVTSAEKRHALTYGHIVYMPGTSLLRCICGVLYARCISSIETGRWGELGTEYIAALAPSIPEIIAACKGVWGRDTWQVGAYLVSQCLVSLEMMSKASAPNTCSPHYCPWDTAKRDAADATARLTTTALLEAALDFLLVSSDEGDICLETVELHLAAAGRLSALTLPIMATVLSSRRRNAWIKSCLMWM